MDTPLLTEHLASGAKIADYSGCLLPESFSDFADEYSAAREAAAIFDTNWHAVVTLAGPDRVRYLNAVVTNNIQSLARDRGTLALLLNPQGHILAEFECYTRPDTLLTLSHASVRERTVATLDKYIIMDDVQLEDLTERVGSIAIEGPRAGSMVQQACGIALNDLPEMTIRDVTVERIPCHLLRRSHFGELGAEFITRRERLGSLWQRLLGAIRGHAGQPIGTNTLNSLRLEAGIPWFPADFDDTVIPQEAALEKTHISFSKGCYTGQEIVERVRSRGHVNRLRVRLKFSSAEVPPAGAKLRVGEKEIGHVTSAGFSPRSSRPIGMGYVRREQAAAGTFLDCETGRAEVIA